MSPDLHLFDVMSRHAVPFVVIGGHAVNVHGYVRATEDTDMLWIRTPATEAGLLRALEEIEARYIGSEIDPATGIEQTHPVSASFIRSQNLMMLCTSVGFVDLFDYVPGYLGVPVATILESAIDVRGIRFASLEWLKRMKR
ncbi:MAG: hypothetical protein WD060_12005, partial [Pirellulales bacterium]